MVTLLANISNVQNVVKKQKYTVELQDTIDLLKTGMMVNGKNTTCVRVTT